jgi:hypothetical protein
MSKDGKDKEVCIFCKNHHPPPSVNDCMMVLLDASERGMVGARLNKKAPKLVATEQQQVIIHDEQGAVGGEPSTHPEDVEAGEGHGDPAYAHLTQFMIAFCHKVDDNFRDMNYQILQLSDESMACRPRQPVQVPPPPPPVIHQVSEQSAASPSLVRRLSTL